LQFVHLIHKYIVDDDKYIVTILLTLSAICVFCFILKFMLA